MEFDYRELLFFVLLFCLCFVVIPFQWRPSNSGDDEALFANFVQQYNKSYKANSKEYIYRLKVFKKSLRRARKLNETSVGSHAAVYGITQFSDLTPEEYRRILKPVSQETQLQRRKNATSSLLGTLLPKLLQSTSTGVYQRIDVPSKVDWREHNVISAVQNQRSCGACWAFSVVETMEAMLAMRTGHLIDLSVQQLVDCAGEGNFGCEGGDTCSVLDWLNRNQINVVNETQYPLDLKTGKCRMEKPDKGVQIGSNFTCYNFEGREDLMMQYLAFHGPIVSAVDASNWQDYLGGIIQYNCETWTNHAVQIVGYDLTSEIPHYIVRNSWGPEFGIAGYLHIAVDKNLCGVAKEVSTLDIQNVNW